MLIGVARPDRDLVGQLAIHVDGGAPAFITVGPQLHAGEIPAEVGGGGDLVHRAGGIAQAEDIGVGTAAQLERIHPERIDRHAAGGLDVVEGDIGVADAAHAIRGVRAEAHVVDHGAGAVGDELGVGVGALGARHIVEHIVDIEHREIGHLLLRHDRDRLAEVLDLRIEAGAGHRVRLKVAVGIGDDFKRRQGDHIFICTRRRGPAGALLVGLHCRYLIGIEAAVLVGVVFRERARARCGRGLAERERSRTGGESGKAVPQPESHGDET